MILTWSIVFVMKIKNVMTVFTQMISNGFNVFSNGRSLMFVNLFFQSRISQHGHRVTMLLYKG